MQQASFTICSSMGLLVAFVFLKVSLLLPLLFHWHPAWSISMRNLQSSLSFCVHNTSFICWLMLGISVFLTEKNSVFRNFSLSLVLSLINWIVCFGVILFMFLVLQVHSFLWVYYTFHQIWKTFLAIISSNTFSAPTSLGTFFIAVLGFLMLPLSLTMPFSFLIIIFFVFYFG